MTEHLPALVFLVPLATAICMPVAGHGRKGVCRPLALLAVAAMAVLSVASLWAVVSRGDVRYSFSGWVPPIGPVPWQATHVTRSDMLEYWINATSRESQP